MSHAQQQAAQPAKKPSKGAKWQRVNL
jgi:hypothetical protein